MTFLNPAILFGLIAAGIPIMLHLLNLKRLKQIEFSTLAFLKEIQKSKIRRVKLKQRLLLVLRVLIIIFLVTSFARPTIQTASIAGTSSVAKSTDIFLFDNSFSMSVVSNNGSLFNQGRKIIKEILNAENDGDERYLIVMSDLLNTPSSADKTSFLKSLDDTQISYISGNTEEVLYRIKNILLNSTNLNRNIYLIGDLQKSTMYSSRTKRTEPDNEYISDIAFYTFEQADNKTNNMAVVDLRSNNQLFELNKEIGFSANIENFSDVKIENTIASLYINGKREAQRSINLNPFETVTVNFQTTLKTTGVITVSCSLEDDDILQDNTRYLGLFVPDKINLLISTDNPADARYVALALNGNKETSRYNITGKSNSFIQSINLSKYNVLVIIGSQQIGNSRNLLDYLNNGGQIILMPGNSSAAGGFAEFMNALHLPANIKEVNTPSTGQIFDAIDFSHPMLANLFEKDADLNITSPSFSKYFRVSTEGKGKSIIDLNDNSTFLSEYGIGKGRVLLFSAAPVLEWSNFPVKSIFAPLINKSVTYLSSSFKQDTDYHPGNEVYVNVAKGAAGPIQVIRPDNSSEYINIDSAKATNFIRYTNTDMIGVYKFLVNGTLSDFITINTDPLESNPAAATQDEFAKLLNDAGLTGKHTHIPFNTDITQLLAQKRTGSELWKLFLIIALLIAVAEMFISRSSKKDLAELNPH